MHFISHSKTWLEEFTNGYSSIIGQSYYDVIPTTSEELRKTHRECLKGKTNISKGHKLTHPNGTVQWLKWKINAWKEEDGTIGGLIIVQEDITEEKRSEELLMKAKSVAQIGGWEVDMASNKVYWTQVTREIHEVSKDYAPNLEEGINFYKQGASRDEITRLVSRAMNDGIPWDTELQIVTAKGRELWIRTKGEAEIVNDKCTRIYGTFQNIDERKRTTLEYQKVSDRLAIATNAAKIGIWDYNIVDNILVWDDNMYDLYGVDQKSFIGAVEAWEACVHPDDKERSLKGVEMALAGEKEFNSEFRVIWPSGEVRHIKAQSIVKRDEEGNSLRMVGANWDITEEKNAEKKLRNLLDITSEQNNSLLNFAHIVSHNLRSHSSNLSMLAGFLYKEENEKERRNLVNMLLDASESLNETVLHLNDVVQVKAGALEEMSSVNLSKTIKDVEKNLSVLLLEKRARCTIEVPETLDVKAIPAYLDSIFLNLFTNSIKYSSPERDLDLKISASKIDDTILVTFSDNGLGIDLDKYGDKLFGMYKTFHKHKDAKGIGLFITKNQIEAMNGKIEVESNVGIGTTFKLCFQIN
jgi:PAS domain S-box-containing protein